MATTPTGKGRSIAGLNLFNRAYWTTRKQIPTSPLDFRAEVDDPYNFCVMPDDVTFDPANGHPAAGDTNTSQMVRQGRYSFAYVLQLPDVAKTDTCDMKVLVFDSRAAGVDPATPSNEVLLNSGSVTQGQTQLTLAADNLGLRSGSWLMDGTIGEPITYIGRGTPNDPLLLLPPLPNRPATIRTANFYRILSVEEVGGNTVVDLETPWKAPTADVAVLSYVPTIYFFRELIDVYDRPQLRSSSNK